jgi:hypothetical protein
MSPCWRRDAYAVAEAVSVFLDEPSGSFHSSFLALAAFERDFDMVGDAAPGCESFALIKPSTMRRETRFREPSSGKSPPFGRSGRTPGGLAEGRVSEALR